VLRGLHAVRRTRACWLPGILGLAALAGAVGLLCSCASFERTLVLPPAIEGATFVGNQACVDCHANYTRVFHASPHARIHLEAPKVPGGTGCESCHGPGSLHVASGGIGRSKFIHNPRQDAGACFQCHQQTHAEFNLPQRHPVLEGRMTCVQCHDPHGMDIHKPAAGGLALSRLNESCVQCHREQSKPHAFEHAALRDGCVSCHAPHGSINAKLLTERDNNLCLKCHAQAAGPTPGSIVIGAVDHTDRVRQGSCFSAGCHTAVHGSNIDRRLLY
jgi:predicted CXXCH cytochrome family protein